MTEFTYVGQELDIFSRAVHWKNYWKQKISPFLGKTVLEVGAGIGATTRVICDDRFESWLALEPDGQMAQYLNRAKAKGEFPANCTFQQGTIADLPAEAKFESILYIDVLEHIECDADEVKNAAAHLSPGGHLIVLSPAYQWLYTPFDAEIGHYRRYTAKVLERLTPPGCAIQRCFYLDSVGLLASLTNKWFLHSEQPSVQQILFWDTFIIPVSRGIDRLSQFRFGRSAVCIWQRTV